LKQVNVKTARSRLRQLLDDVENGEEFIVVRRGKPVARLVPAKAAGSSPFPPLHDFRGSIRVRGRSLSAQVVEARRRQRY
jgi:prevent-host-death family protein